MQGQDTRHSWETGAIQACVSSYASQQVRGLWQSIMGWCGATHQGVSNRLGARALQDGVAANTQQTMTQECKHSMIKVDACSCCCACSLVKHHIYSTTGETGHWMVMKVTARLLLEICRFSTVALLLT
jgi:hypothetical protein